jgi:hypothetical protein
MEKKDYETLVIIDIEKKTKEQISKQAKSDGFSGELTNFILERRGDYVFVYATYDVGSDDYKVQRYFMFVYDVWDHYRTIYQASNVIDRTANYTIDQIVDAAYNQHKKRMEGLGAVKK